MEQELKAAGSRVTAAYQPQRQRQRCLPPKSRVLRGVRMAAVAVLKEAGGFQKDHRLASSMSDPEDEVAAAVQDDPTRPGSLLT